MRSVFLVILCVFSFIWPVRAQNVSPFHPMAPVFEPLTPLERSFAQTAWRYFEANTDVKTGLVPSVERFPSMTMWDQGAYFLAVVSAYKLGLISKPEAVSRLSLALQSLQNLPLYKGWLPNKAYNTSTLRMTDYTNTPTPKGIGWSALDIMRLIAGLFAASQTFPEVLADAQVVIERWNLQQLVEGGRFRGLAVRGQLNGRYVQEGRIGYEQYAGRTGMKIGLPVQLAAAYDPIVRWQEYYDIRLPGDIRTRETHGISAVTTSEPFILEALEYGWRPSAFEVSTHVFEAQIFRYIRTGYLTALSEDHMRGAPYFAYHTVLVDHQPFVSVTAQRADVSNRRAISLKAAFGWWALMRHPYTVQLIQAMVHLQTERGWYAGLFEADMSVNKILTLNTNAVILEALHYKALGPLIQ